jgi:hypothetical protein
MPELNLGRSSIPVAKGVNYARWGERFTDLRSAANTYPVGMPARKGRNNRHHEHELLLKTETRSLADSKQATQRQGKTQRPQGHEHACDPNPNR